MEEAAREENDASLESDDETWLALRSFGVHVSLMTSAVQAKRGSLVRLACCKKASVSNNEHRR
jgi:hypothetical protein